MHKQKIVLLKHHKNANIDIMCKPPTGMVYLKPWYQNEIMQFKKKMTVIESKRHMNRYTPSNIFHYLS